MSLLLQCLTAVLIFSHSQHIFSADVEITVVALGWRLQTFFGCTPLSVKNL